MQKSNAFTCDFEPVERIFRITLLSFQCSSRVLLLSLSTAVPLPLVLHHGEQNNLREGIQLSKYQEDINHLDIGSCRKHLHDCHEDGGHDQHGGQIDTESGLEKVRLEESGGIGGYHKEDRGRGGLLDILGIEKVALNH